MMSPQQSFAFRMPPEVKHAAKCLSLSSNSIFEPRTDSRGNEVWVSIGGNSINDSLLWLISRGIRHALFCVQHALSEDSEKLAQYTEILSFFISNPLVNEASREHYAADGAAARYFKDIDKWREDHLKWAARWEEEPEPKEELVTRSEIADRYAQWQRSVAALTAAVGAVAALVEAEDAKLADWLEREKKHESEAEERRLSRIREKKAVARRGNLKVVV